MPTEGTGLACCHIPKFSFRNVNHFSHKKLKISKIIHFSCETFPNKVIQKNFLLSTFIQKGSQRFIKSLPNWNQSPSRHRAIHVSSDSGEINRSFLLLVYLIPSLPPAHLRRATKLAVKVKITATTSYSEGDYFPTIPSWNSIKEWPNNGDYFLIFMTAISAVSSIGTYHNNSAFHSHQPPNNVWPSPPPPIKFH
jgi:hypothetical protein